MEAGGIALVNYGERPVCWHTRLLLAKTQGASWVVLNPDCEIYEEEMSPANPDSEGFYYSGLAGGIPGHIPPEQVYGFQPMMAQEMGQYLIQGRATADSITGVQAAAPLTANHAGASPAAGAGEGLEANTWVCMEAVGPYSRGEVLATDPLSLPAGSVVVGEKGVVPAGSEKMFVMRVKAADVPDLALEDLRVPPVKFDVAGSRRRDFSSG